MTVYLTSQQPPQGRPEHDPIMLASAKRARDNRRYLLLFVTAAGQVQARDLLTGEYHQWNKTEAQIAAGSYLAADYALVCWDAYEVLHTISFVKGSAGDRMERANFYQFRFVPAARDVQAMPLDRGTLELSAYWQQHKVEDVDGWRFVLDWGTPCYDLRPLATVMLGLAAADLEDRRPAHVDDLEQLLDNLLSVYRAMWGDGETVATMLNNIKGTASLAKDVLKRIGYHPAAPAAELTAAVKEANRLAKSARKDSGLMTARDQAAQRVKELAAALPERNYQGWPVEQAYSGPILQFAAGAGRVLANYAALDYRSMYCLVAEDCGLWQLQRARYVISRAVEGDELADLLAWVQGLDYHALSPRKHPDLWRRLVMLARVRLAPGDWIAQRTLDAATGQITTRWQMITSIDKDAGTERVITMFDVVASQLWGGKQMQVLAALELTASEQQQELKPISLFGEDVDFNTASPYSYFVERKERARDRHERRAMKQIAVALYGINGEVHSPRLINYGRPEDEEAAKQLGGGDVAGKYYHTLIASMTTAAARLRLLLQVMAAGGFQAIGCIHAHTDSLIVPAVRVSALLAWDHPGVLRPVKASITSEELTGPGINVLVMGIGRWAAWRDGDGDINLLHHTRAGFNYQPALSAADEARVIKGMIQQAAINTAGRAAASQSRADRRGALPLSVRLQEATLFQLRPNADPGDPFWSTPLASPFRLRPETYWQISQHMIGLAPMQRMVISIAADPDYPRYIAPEWQWGKLAEGEEVLTVLLGGDGQPVYQFLPFRRGFCANLFQLARAMANPAAHAPAQVEIGGQLTLPRRFFEFGLAKVSSFSDLLIRASLQPGQSFSQLAPPPAAP